MSEVIFDTTKLKYNTDTIKSVFKTVGTVIMVTKDIRVVFPERFIARGLATVGSTVKVVNIFAVIDDKNNYAAVIAPVMIEINPVNIKTISVDGVPNKLLEFREGDIFTGNRALVRNAAFMYDLFDEFFLKGKIPWYLGYDHVSSLLAEASKYAGSNIGKDPLAMEILTAIIARSDKDKGVYYRQTIKSKEGSDPQTYVGLNNVYHSYNNTASKLVGGYYAMGVSVAIVKPEEETTTVSKALRA